MKKLCMGVILCALVIAVPIPTMAQVNIRIGISLPLIRFNAPPDVVVMPDSDDVYFVPDIDEDMFFWNGWWWRPYEGRWYRSHYYDRGWSYYNNIPSFYYDIDPGWRRYYGDRNWYGHRWDYDRIPYRRLHQNWSSWHNNHYWERQKTWGVKGYQPRPEQQREELRHQRQEQYRQRPDVKRQQQQSQEQQNQIQRDQQQKQEQQNQFQRDKQQRQEQLNQADRYRQDRQEHQNQFKRDEQQNREQQNQTERDQQQKQEQQNQIQRDKQQKQEQQNQIQRDQQQKQEQQTKGKRDQQQQHSQPQDQKYQGESKDKDKQSQGKPEGENAEQVK